MKILVKKQNKPSNAVQRRLTASAMGMAIVISLLIAFVSGFFILRSHLSKVNELRYEIKNNLIHNAQSGIQLMLGSPSIVILDDSLDMDLFGNGHDSVRLHRTTWGTFEMIHATAYSGKESYTISSLVGNKIPPKHSRTGLYLCDLDRQIGICGKTLLYGVNYLPNEGLKRTYIEGQSFSENKLVQGDEKASERLLPEINTALIQSLNDRLTGKLQTDEEFIDFYSMSLDSIYRSFDNPTLLLHSAGSIYLNQQSLNGRIVVRSNSKISVGSECELNKVILCAPVIEIEAGFQGNPQLIASQSIEIGDDVELSYPSSITLIAEKPDSTERRFISFGDNCQISGSVIAVNSDQGQLHKISVNTAKEFKMQGEMFIQGDLDLKGEVSGSVFCHKIVLRTPSAIYENQLLNIAIRPDLLPDYFALSALLSDSKRTILSWL
jgi:hypothetical protein